MCSNTVDWTFGDHAYHAFTYRDDVQDGVAVGQYEFHIYMDYREGDPLLALAGSFVRLNIVYNNEAADPENAPNVKIGIRFGGRLHALAFSDGGVVKNSMVDSIFNSSGSVIARNSVFRLVRSSKCCLLV
jgi:hypothetical protein